MITKIKGIFYDGITFENGYSLGSYHNTDCCENHYLEWDYLKEEDVKGLEFDLSNDNFFERVEGYGIRLKPLNGHPLFVPGYADNNGYYSDDLHLTLIDNQSPCNIVKEWDITECQKDIYGEV